MRVQVVLLVLLAWHAASVTGDSSEHDAQSTFKYTEPPLSPEVASSPPLELPSSSPTESEGSRSHFDYRRKPPDFVFPPWDHAGFYKSPPPPPHVESKFPEWVKTKNGGFFKRERKRNLALLSAMDQKFVQADVLIYGDSVTALNKPTNLSTGIKGSRKPFSRNFGDLYAEPLGVPADRIGNLMWRLAVGTERPVFQNPKVVVIFIGVNDLRDRTSTTQIATRMDFLLNWIERNMRGTSIVLQALLPGLSRAEEVNEKYAELARKYRIKFSLCGTDINEKNKKRYMADRLHPNNSGQNLWLSCLREEVVQPILNKKKSNYRGRGLKSSSGGSGGQGSASGSTPVTAPRATITNIPGLPKWVVGRDNSMFNREFRRNMAAIKRIDQKGQRMDIALYGDSITYWNKPGNLSKVAGSRAVWNEIFGDLNAEPLGIPGDRVGTLIYRIAILKERPVVADPRVCIIFAGINDVVHKSTDPGVPIRMDYLIRLTKKKMPQSKIVIQALLPSLSRAPAVNEGYKKIAKKNNVVFSTCGQDIERGDRRYMADILHPNKRGQRKVLRCLNKLVRPMLVDCKAGR